MKSSKYNISMRTCQSLIELSYICAHYSTQGSRTTRCDQHGSTFRVNSYSQSVYSFVRLSQKAWLSNPLIIKPSSLSDWVKGFDNHWINPENPRIKSIRVEKKAWYFPLLHTLTLLTITCTQVPRFLTCLTRSRVSFYVVTTRTRLTLCLHTTQCMRGVGLDPSVLVFSLSSYNPPTFSPRL
jgi:hypothetical protein